MIQSGVGFNKGVVRFGYFCVVYCYIVMNKQVGWFVEVVVFQYGRLEQVVEVNDIFIDEVVQFGGGVFFLVFIEVYVVVVFVVQIFERIYVVNWCVQLDVEIFVWCVWNFKIKVWCVVRDILLLQVGFKLFLYFICYLFL